MGPLAKVASLFILLLFAAPLYYFATPADVQTMTRNSGMPAHILADIAARRKLNASFDLNSLELSDHYIDLHGQISEFNPHDNPSLFWGPPNGEFNWCERNYKWNEYVAEPFNTITAFAYLVWGYLNVYIWHKKVAPVHIRLEIALIALMGLGSMAFHVSLRYPMQLVDELPLYSLCSYGAFLVYFHENFQDPLESLPADVRRVLSAKSPKSVEFSKKTRGKAMGKGVDKGVGKQAGDLKKGKRKLRSFKNWSGIFKRLQLVQFAPLTVLTVILFGSNRHSTLHEWGRIGLAGFALFYGYIFIKMAFVSQALNEKYRRHCIYHGIGDDRFKRRVYKEIGFDMDIYPTQMFNRAFVWFLIALSSWVADNLICSYLHALPLSVPYLQLHATGWHFGTMIGLHYLSVTYIVHFYLHFRFEYVRLVPQTTLCGYLPYVGVEVVKDGCEDGDTDLVLGTTNIRNEWMLKKKGD